eukprot:1747568-Prymnesium_polylepis.2
MDNFSHWTYPKSAHLERPGGALNVSEREQLHAEAARCNYATPDQCPPPVLAWAITSSNIAMLSVIVLACIAVASFLSRRLRCTSAAH